MILIRHSTSLPPGFAADRELIIDLTAEGGVLSCERQIADATMNSEQKLYSIWNHEALQSFCWVIS
jgi:hypothetical protein